MVARRLVLAALTRLPEGRLTLVEGDASTAFGPGGTPSVTVTVHDERFWTAALRGGTVGLGRAYADGWFDVDDLAALVRLLVAGFAPVRRRLDRIANVVAPARARLPSRSRGRAADRDHVAAHYDLSNDFFSLMLDPTMTYSCALFDHTVTSLETAQLAKLERICDLLDLSERDHLLEIGTGWGGLAVHAAATRGCRVTTTTISANQHEHARKRVAALELEDRVEVVDADYRDLGGTYDKVVSIEMIEAVDWRDHPTYFSTLAERLRPGGRAALQAIVVDDRSYERAKRNADFVKTAIFPGGCLPSISSMVRAAGDAGLSTAAVHRIGQHYPETLLHWQENIDVSRCEIERLGFDERFLRTWRFYLQYCIGGFESRYIDAVHLVLEKG
jgi:cyclopropane-fatty-acyl-phospholipid synthase